MHHTLGDRKSLSRGELDCLIFQINDEAPFHHIKEFIFPIVLVPVELSLHNAKPHDAVIHPAQRLVIPRVGDCIDEFLNVNEFKRTIACVRWIEYGSSVFITVSSSAPRSDAVYMGAAIRSRRGLDNAR